MLIRARIPEWASVHEMVARMDMLGSGFERTMVGGISSLAPVGAAQRHIVVPMRLRWYSQPSVRACLPLPIIAVAGNPYGALDSCKL